MQRKRCVADCGQAKPGFWLACSGERHECFAGKGCCRVVGTEWIAGRSSEEVKGRVHFSHPSEGGFAGGRLSFHFSCNMVQEDSALAPKTAKVHLPAWHSTRTMSCELLVN